MTLSSALTVSTVAVLAIGRCGSSRIDPVPPSDDTCRRVGPLACDVQPATLAQVCSRVRECVTGRQFDGVVVSGVNECEEPVLSAELGGQQVGVIAMYPDLSGAPSQSVALIANGARGWCPVDIAMPPTYPLPMGYCEMSAGFRSDSKGSLIVAVGRMCPDTLDADEAAAGVTRERGRECQELRYRVADGALIRKGARDVDHSVCWPE